MCRCLRRPSWAFCVVMDMAPRQPPNILAGHSRAAEPAGGSRALSPSLFPVAPTQLTEQTRRPGASQVEDAVRQQDSGKTGRCSSPAGCLPFTSTTQGQRRPGLSLQRRARGGRWKMAGD